jgi:hypothetical protein
MRISRLPVSEAWERWLSEGNITLEKFIGQNDGVELIEKAFTGDGERCVWFAFGNEEWYQKGDPGELNRLLMGPMALGFLGENGYREVTSPQDYDIVVYPSRELQDMGYIDHYGVYIAGGVVSKLGRLHIVRHELEVIPCGFGDEVIFLRKP